MAPFNIIMSRWRRGSLRAAAVLLSALAAPGCQATNPLSGEPSDPGTGIEMTNPSSPTPALAAQARQLLAERLNIDPQDIDVVEVSEVTWPDSSLGCPRPGMAYAQRLVNGSRIVLRAQGREFHYHAGAGRGPFYCEHPQAPVPNTGYGDV